MSYTPHPLRRQRRRTKGWRMEPNGVCVTRPGKFGNPFPTADEFSRVLGVVLLQKSNGFRGYSFPSIGRKQWDHMWGIANNLRELRGMLLYCYCPLDKPCHADELARMANQ